MKSFVFSMIELASALCVVSLAWCDHKHNTSESQSLMLIAIYLFLVARVQPRK